MNTLVDSALDTSLSAIYSEPGIGVKTLLKSIIMLLNKNIKVYYYEDLGSLKDSNSDCDFLVLYYKKPIHQKVFNEIRSFSSIRNKTVIVGMQMMKKEINNLLPMFENVDTLIKLSRNSISDNLLDDYNITTCQIISKLCETRTMFLEYDKKMQIFKNIN